MIELRSDEASQSGPVRPATATSAEGQTEKHSARADVFHSSPKNGRWFKTLRASNFMEYRSEVTRLDWRTTSRRVRLARRRHRLYPWRSQPSVTQSATIPATSFPRRRTP